MLAVVVVVVIVAGPVLEDGRERLASGWTPVGDDAMLVVNAYDAPSLHTPTHGMPASLGFGRERAISHPGPLLFWVLAAPLRLTGGSSVALVLVLVALQIASILAAAFLVRRRAGPGGVLLLLFGIAVCELALGHDILGSPLNPFAVLLPLVTFFVAAWDVALGDDIAIPFAVFFGSLPVLSHFAFLPLVATVGLVSTVLYFDERRHELAPRHSRPRAQWIALSIAIVCWLPVLINTITDFPGNFLRSIGHGETANAPATIGLPDALRAVVHVLAQYRLWWSAVAGHRAALYGPVGIGEVALAAAGIVLLAAAARRDRRVRALAYLVGIAMCALIWTVSRLPQPVLFEAVGAAGARDRLIYVVGAAYLVALVAGACVLLGELLPSTWLRIARAAAVPVAAALAVGLALTAAARRTPDDVFHVTRPDRATSETVHELVDARAQLP